MLYETPSYTPARSYGLSDLGAVTVPSIANFFGIDYTWTQVGGPSVYLLAPISGYLGPVIYSFKAPNGAIKVFTVSATKTITNVVTQSPAPPPPPPPPVLGARPQPPAPPSLTPVSGPTQTYIQTAAPIVITLPSGWTLVGPVQPSGVFPWYSQKPDASGNWPSGNQQFLWADIFGSLNKGDVSLGAYGHSSSDLGAVTLSNGRQYELIQHTIKNFRTGFAQNFYETWEGGASGNIVGQTLSRAAQTVGSVLQPISAPLTRAVTALTTGGLTELVRAVPGGAPIAQSVEAVQGGAIVGVPVGFVTSGFNPVGAVAGGATGAIQGVKAAVSGQPLDIGSTVVGSAVSGAVAGIAAQVAKAVTAVTGKAPVQVVPESRVISFGPGEGVYLPPGSTLLPPSLSFTPPVPLSEAFVAVGAPGYGLRPISISGSAVNQPFPAYPLRPPIEGVYLPPGGTLLPPPLSLTPPTLTVGGLVPSGVTGLLNLSLQTIEKYLPKAVGTYKAYQELFPPSSDIPESPLQDGGIYTNGSPDETVPPGGEAETPPEKPFSPIPLLLGAGLLFFLMKK